MLIGCFCVFVDDPRRPFLHAERDRLVSLCKEYNVPVNIQSYFEGDKPSLKMHFEVINQMQF